MRTKAFTLIESVAVLIIVSAILLIGLSGFRQRTVQFEEDFFWKRFEVEWDKAKQQAIYSHKETTIRFDKEKHHIAFLTGSYFNHYTYKVKIPRNLDVWTTRFVTLESSGYLAPQTVNFYENGKRKYQLKFQLGWGVYQLEKVR